MAPLPLLNEGDLDLVASHAVSGEQRMNLAVVDAFLAAGLDVDDQTTTLADWIDPDAFETLHWNDDKPIYLCTHIWDHPVVVTADEIRIYAADSYRNPEPRVRDMTG